MKHAWTLAVALALCATQPAVADDRGNTPPALAGTWQVSVIYYYEGVTDGISGKLTYLQQFDKDGRAAIFLSQNTDLDPFNETRTACVGEWKHRRARVYDVTLYCLWNETWDAAPAVPDRIRMKVSLDADGLAWSATPFYYEMFIGGEYVHTTTPQSWGAMSGVRLGIVPIR